jgi:short-subunit dehydrogenase
VLPRLCTNQNDGAPGVIREAIGTAEEVASDIYQAYQKGKDIIYTKWLWRWITAIIKLLPEKLFKRLKL